MPEKSTFNPDKSFTVRESIGANIALGVVFLALFISTFFTVDFKHFSISSAANLPFLAIIPAVLFFIKAKRHKLIIEVNRDGFYYLGKEVTNWKYFISAKYIEEEKAFRVSDNFVLLIEYFKPDEPRSFITKIKLGNTQNKSEEDIIEAIGFYHGLSGFQPMVADED